MRLLQIIAGLAISTLASATTVQIDSAIPCTWSEPARTLTCTAPTPTVPPPVVVPPPPLQGWSGQCPSFDRTLVAAWDWSSTQSHMDTAAMGGLGTNGILVVSFVPTGPADSVQSSISATGYPAPNMTNTLTLSISERPCDLAPPEPAFSISTSPSVPYVVGTSPVYWATGKKIAAETQPNRIYYLSVAGRDGLGQTCAAPYPGWNCDVRLSLQKPQGH